MLVFVRRSRAALAAVIGATMLCAGLAVPAAAASERSSDAAGPAAVGRTLFQNVNSRKCLEVIGWRTDDFAPVGQYDCHGGGNQTWNYSTDTGLIQNVHSGKCLDVEYAGDGARAIQNVCGRTATQYWVMVRSTSLIGNQATGRCLEIYGGSLDNFARANLWNCNGSGGGQHWWWN